MMISVGFVPPPRTFDNLLFNIVKGTEENKTGKEDKDEEGETVTFFRSSTLRFESFSHSLIAFEARSQARSAGGIGEVN